MKNTLTLFIGIPGQGKSTFCDIFRSKPKHTIIEADSLRFLLPNFDYSVGSDDNEWLAREIMNFCTESLNRAPENHIVVDDCLNCFEIILEFKEYCKYKGLELHIQWLDQHCPLETAVLRNEGRKGTSRYVSPNVIVELFLTFESIKERLSEMPDFTQYNQTAEGYALRGGKFA